MSTFHEMVSSSVSLNLVVILYRLWIVSGSQLTSTNRVVVSRRMTRIGRTSLWYFLGRMDVGLPVSRRATSFLPLRDILNSKSSPVRCNCRVRRPGLIACTVSFLVCFCFHFKSISRTRLMLSTESELWVTVSEDWLYVSSVPDESCILFTSSFLSFMLVSFDLQNLSSLVHHICPVLVSLVSVTVSLIVVIFPTSPSVTLFVSTVSSVRFSMSLFFWFLSCHFSASVVARIYSGTPSLVLFFSHSIFACFGSFSVEKNAATWMC